MYQKGIKRFGEAGRKATGKELDQLHQRNCCTPIDINDLTPEEITQAMEALMFLQEKNNETMKGRMTHNGKPNQSGCLEKTRQAALQLWKACSSQA